MSWKRSWLHWATLAHRYYDLELWMRKFQHFDSETWGAFGFTIEEATSLADTPTEYQPNYWRVPEETDHATTHPVQGHPDRKGLQLAAAIAESPEAAKKVYDASNAFSDARTAKRPNHRDHQLLLMSNKQDHVIKYNIIYR